MNKNELKNLVPIFAVIILAEALANKILFVGGEPYLGIRTDFNFLKGLILMFVIGSYLRLLLPEKLKFGFKSFVFGSIVVLFFAYCSSQSDFYYHILKISQRGWEGEIYKENATLGYENVSNYKGFRNVPLLPKIPTKTDQNGFRIPIKDTSKIKLNTSILFLGCSFTFGDACSADATFPYQTQLKTGFKTYNAGVCGYGSSQMLLKGQQIIPTLQPNFVVVQYSPWIIDRAMYPFSPSVVGKVPTPIARVENDSLIITPPVFKSKVFDLPINKFIPGAKRFSQYISFYFKVGMPLSIHDNIKVLQYRIQEKRGKIKLQDFEQPNEIAIAIYQAFQKVCEANNTQLVVLSLGLDQSKPDEVLKQLKADENIIVVDADKALWKALRAPNAKEYDLQYKHWAEQNGARFIVDEHPNAKAHGVIAEEVVKVISSIQ